MGAYALFKKYPNANVYTIPNSNRLPGTIQIKGNSDLNQQLIVNLFGQYYPGKPRKNETEHTRLQWFKNSLDELSKIGESLHSVAFPYLIGCGLAGGNWILYRHLINDFAKKVSSYGVKVSIV